MEKELVSEQEPENQRELLSSLIPPDLHQSARRPVSPPSDQAYSQAAVIFQLLHAERSAAHQLQYEKKPGMLLPARGDKATRLRAYQLAFNTLKYQDLLEYVVSDSCFHKSQHVCAELLPLAMVMLFDFQDRKFKKRLPHEGQEAIQEIRDVETGLQKWKIKLAASLARYRVKQNLWSVSCYLSDPVRVKHHTAKSLPLYAWVNSLRTSIDEVCEALKGAGLHEVENMSNLREFTFSRDSLCPDTLVFPEHLHALLHHSALSNSHMLNTQDRSVCVAMSVLQPVLFDGGDVLVTGSFSAMTLAHIAVVAAARSGRVLVCGSDHTPSHLKEMQELLEEMEIKNVRVLTGAFCRLNEWDVAVQRLKVIIVLPQCSSSALHDPVATMLSEHGDWGLLPELSHGFVSKSKMYSLTAQQTRLLGHALSLPKVQTVVYCTRSVYDEENEHLVQKVLEKTYTPPKLLPFRVSGPIFPVDSTSEDTTHSKFFHLQPSQLTNGCFIARLSRQIDPTKVETVQDVLARAVAKGLLGDLLPNPTKMGKNEKSKKNQGGSSPSSQDRLDGGLSPEDFPRNEEDNDGEDGEDKTGETEGKGGKKKKRKRMGKRSQKQTKNGSTKKPTKKKTNPANQKKNKARRIPRLTLALISEPSSQLSSITALAHKISSDHGKHPTSTPIETHVSLMTTKKQNARPKASEKTQKHISVPQGKEKGADLVLPPIPHRPGSTPQLSISRSPSQTSNYEQANISASSSSVFLPEI